MKAKLRKALTTSLRLDEVLRDVPGLRKITGSSGDKPRPAVARPSKRRRPRRGRRRHSAFTAAAMHRAWRDVRSSGGGAGVDGETIAHFEADLPARLGQLGSELSRGKYRPRGVRRVFVPKPKGGLRPLVIWTLRDRVAQRAVYNAVAPRFESRFLDCSHGFRPGRSTATAVAQVAEARDEGFRWVLDADIQDCFDSIDAERLTRELREWLDDRQLCRTIECWLTAEARGRDGRRHILSAAQGGVLSPLLCNVYLHSFDLRLQRRDLRLVRYADDFVCLVRRRRDLKRARQRVETALQERGLRLNPGKTRETSFDEGFAFLGYFLLRDECHELSPRGRHTNGGGARR